MSNRNSLLSQTFCHYLNQGRTFYDILMRAMAYFDLGNLNLAQPIVLKACLSNCNVNRRVKVALKTTYIKMSNSRLSKLGQVVRIQHIFTTATI